MEQNKNKRLDDLFNQAKNEPAKISFEETKTQFIKSTATFGKVAKGGKLTQFTNFKLILMITTIAAITIGTVLFFNNSSDANTKKEATSEHIKFSITDSALIVGEHEKVVKEYFEKVEALSPQLLDVDTNEKRLKKRKHKTIDKTWFLEEQKDSKNNVIETVDNYRFPTLSEKDKDENAKLKYTMLRELARYKRMPSYNNIDNRKYPMVYWNKAVKDDKVTSIDATGAFHIQKTEVSNLEYRTFLFDLLIQNRKEEFLSAKPDQSRWIKDYKSVVTKPMQENYFSHPAYNDYPVVAISREGAEMYCEWLTVERNKLNPEKYGLLVNDVRLPTAEEWVQAAKGRVDSSSYSWAGASLKNSRGCYLANFKPTKDSYIDDGGFFTVKSDSYNPNGYGLFCMSGNVAEMVIDEKNEPATKGGSWSSAGQELHIVEGADRFKGLTQPSVDVGFRPVISYLGSRKGEGLSKVDQSKSIPSLTWKEIAENNKRKKAMSKVVGKLQPFFGFVKLPAGEMTINGSKVKQKSFHIKQTEVTNIQYKTFLFDLLIQGRKDEFLSAKPDQTNWEKVKGGHGEVMKQNYFSHTMYNDHPVVNISREGALMFCEWLSNEMNKAENKKLKGMTVKMTIPSKNQWIYAAKGGKDNLYGWDITTLQNEHGCYLANFKYQKGQGQQPFTDCEVKKLNASTTSGLMLGYENFTTKINAYNPNEFGLYCMSGNVAEMIFDENNLPATKGGSWSSVGQELKLVEGKDRFKGVTSPNINIGFRPVVTIVKE